jgi:hypothetical protein
MTEPLFTLHITFPGRWLTLNDRLHWAEQRRHKTYWLDATLVAWYAAGRPRAMPPCVVTSELVVPTKRRRDGHNFIATLKPIIDQLVALDVWPDDNTDWVTVDDPTFTIRPGPQSVVLRAFAR